jgi:hypothetical protein
MRVDVYERRPGAPHNAKERGHLAVLQARLDHLQAVVAARGSEALRGDADYQAGEIKALRWALQMLGATDPAALHLQRVVDRVRVLESRMANVERLLEEDDED